MQKAGCKSIYSGNAFAFHGAGWRSEKEMAIDARGETDKKPWYEWEWSEIIEESNFITFPYEDYWVCRHKHAHDAFAVGETRQDALDNCILVLCLSSSVERADNQEDSYDE